MFLQVSVILFTWGGGISQHALQVSRPTPGGKLRGLAWGGVSRPTPRMGSSGPHLGGGLWAHTQGGSPGPHLGGIPACTEADTPSSRRLLLRAVRILLECILVLVIFTKKLTVSLINKGLIGSVVTALTTCRSIQTNLYRPQISLR